jgi:hypothetical protein
VLNGTPTSPFNGLIRRESDAPDSTAVVTDRPLVEAIKRNLKAPMGALSQYKRNGEGFDADAMLRARCRCTGRAFATPSPMPGASLRRRAG